MQILGLDIGGANIKAANIDGRTFSLPFEMWKNHLQLPQAVKSIAQQMNSGPDLVGLTMTAELADCFETKADGVRFVVESVVAAFPNAQIRTWMTGSEFAEPEDAVELPELVAAANWHAQATWIARSIPQGQAVLLDMGSTTTDIIPLEDGWPIPLGLNDRDRLASGELVYVGASRTPLCALLNEVILEGRTFPVAAEFFSSMADAAILCGFAAEQPDCRETADGRPLTTPFAAARLARMLCCDVTELSDHNIQSIAQRAFEAIVGRISKALNQVLDRLHSERGDCGGSPTLVLSGSGADFVSRALNLNDDPRFESVMNISEMYHSDVSSSACAFAVARLVHDRCRQDLLEERAF